MPSDKPISWGRGEMYETLCLLMIGVCCWLIGITLGAFEVISGFILTNRLTEFLMLATCMGLALLGASIRKSFVLRRIMLERDAAARQAEVRSAERRSLTGPAG